ncbi:MAG: hypothetical protein OXH32_05525 [Acidobacteria bacterium]|nr:hypothetical protein [Acidobacteriota bacterium]
MGASDWLRSISRDRDAFADTPALTLWGLKDIAFRRKESERWTSRFGTSPGMAHVLRSFVDGFELPFVAVPAA